MGSIRPLDGGNNRAKFCIACRGDLPTSNIVGHFMILAFDLWRDVNGSGADWARRAFPAAAHTIYS